MAAKQDRDAEGTEGPEAGNERIPQRRDVDWVKMLAWIAFAFLVAGLVAYGLVAPFFRHS